MYRIYVVMSKRRIATKMLLKVSMHFCEGVTQNDERNYSRSKGINVKTRSVKDKSLQSAATNMTENLKSSGIYQNLHTTSFKVQVVRLNE